MNKVELQAKVDILKQEIDFLTALFEAVSTLISAYLTGVSEPKPTALQKNRNSSPTS